MENRQQDFFFSEIASLDFPARLPDTLYEVQQNFEHSNITDVRNEIRQAFHRSSILENLPKGSNVAVGVGSRGISNILMIVRTVIDVFKEAGAKPFVIPSMGSHGGGIAEGQVELLAELGITPEAIGAEIKATMEVNQIGVVENGPNLYMDVNAVKADATFIIGRIKPHTDFIAELESGLSKMCVIGLGKKVGAEAMHAFGAKGFRNFLAPAARIYEKNTNLLGGLAILENAISETAELMVLSSSQIGTKIEKDLLIKARGLMASLPFKNIDILVLKEIGKNISGTGMDTNVIGKLMIPREAEPTEGPDIAVIGVLDVTEESHGNASGMGIANVTTLRLANQINWRSTYTNAITTSTFGMQRVSVPIMMSNDKKALQVLSRGCGVPADKSRWVFANNTSKLGRLWVSKNMIKDIESISRLEIIKEIPLTFNNHGNMISPWVMSDVDQFKGKVI